MKTFKCIYCFREYIDDEKRKACQESHYDDLVFVPLLKKDLQTLAHFIMSEGRSEMTESAYNSILRYFRKYGKNDTFVQ